MKKAIFPGSFDPITLGHEDIIKRGILLFDEIVIAIGINAEKNTCFHSKKENDSLRKPSKMNQK